MQPAARDYLNYLSDIKLFHLLEVDVGDTVVGRSVAAALCATLEGCALLAGCALGLCLGVEDVLLGCAEGCLDFLDGGVDGCDVLSLLYDLCTDW